MVRMGGGISLLPNSAAYLQKVLNKYKKEGFNMKKIEYENMFTR